MENINPWFTEGSSKARLVCATPDAEAAMAYIARVTSKDQNNPNFKSLLKYCFKHGHWSVAEQSYMTVEVITPLAIAVQLLRHRSMNFQQFSGRYEEQTEMFKHTEGLLVYNDIFYLPNKARLQDTENRQNSIVSSDPDLTERMREKMTLAYSTCLRVYQELIDMGIAKEEARFVLPQGVYSRLYVSGSCRSWVHYLKVRDDEGVAQYEHCELARCAKKVFSEVFPTVFDSVNWASVSKEQELEKELAECKSIIAKLSN